MKANKITLRVSADDDDVAYLMLPSHIGQGKFGAVAKQIRLLDILQYCGPDVYLDLDGQGNLVGIEILT